jgi:hypothetical protein
MPGDTLTIKVERYDGPSERVNLQINFVRVELERDHFAFGSGQEADIGSAFEVSITVPQEAQSGPYFLADFRGLDIELAGDPLPSSEPRVLIADSQPLEGRAFYVGEQPQDRPVVEEIQYLHGQRLDRIRKTFHVGDLPHALTVQVAFLYSGLLVHGQQHCQGYSIIPYGSGLSPASSIGAMNEFASLAFGAVFPETEGPAAEYSQSKPLAAIVVHRVGAETLQAAFEGIRPLVDDVALALAFDRGHIPEPFAAVACSGLDMMMWLLHRPYRGNLVPPFGATETGAQIERLTGAMSRTPFSKLLLELYVQARGEADPMFQLFRFWAVLELLAKRVVPKGLAVTDAHGQEIVEDGKVVKTDGAAARVYKYLFDQGMGGSHGSYQDGNGTYSLVVEASHPTPALEGPGLKITMWDAVRAFYAVRNGVAHDGRFEPDDASAPGSKKSLATALLKSPHQDFLSSHFSELTKISVLRTLWAQN